MSFTNPARLVALSVALAMPAGAAGQTRPTPAVTGPQFLDQRNREELLEHFGALVGMLNPEAEKPFQQWELTVNAWQKEPSAGADARLAAGVLYDCLTRLHGVWPPALTDHKNILVWSIPEKRVKQATESLKAAMNLDRTLVEARFRFDRIRAAKDRSAAADLEQLATTPAPAPYGYLSAVIRAEIAAARDDEATAKRWYARALVLFPESTAARIGLSALSAGATPFEVARAEDPYYAYPCRVMTPAVASALAERIRLRTGG